MRQRTLDSPEQVRILRFIASQDVTVRSNELDLDKVVDGESVLRCQPTEPPSKSQTSNTCSPTGVLNVTS